MMTTERIHLFSNGTQYMDWTFNNCDKCALAGDPSEPGSSSCDLFEAICDAGADDGTVSAEIAARLGYSPIRYVWRCPEFTKDVPPALAQKRELEALATWNAWASGR